MNTDDEPLRLDVLIEHCMVKLGMTLEEAEAEVRDACETLGEAVTEVGHA